MIARFGRCADARLRRGAVRTLAAHRQTQDRGGGAGVPFETKAPLDDERYLLELDHSHIDFNSRGEKRRRKTTEETHEVPVRPTREWSVGRRGGSAADESPQVWDSHPNYPNPIAPRSFIDFRRLDDPRSILNALHDTQDYLQMRQVVAALARCRTAGMALHPNTVRAVLDLGARTLGSTRMEDVVGLFLSCARFKISDRSEFLNDIARLTIDRGFVKAMTIREIATMIHSCGCLIRLAEKRVGHRLRGGSEENPQPMTAPTGFEDHGEFASGLPGLENLLDVLIEEVALLREPDDELELRLPSILKSLSFFGRKDSRLDRSVAQLATSLVRFRDLSEDRIASIIFSIANCGQVKRDIVDQISMEVTKRDRLATFATTQLIGIIQAFSQLKVKNRGMWMAIFFEAAQSTRLQELSKKQVEILLKSLMATETIEDEEITRNVIKEAFSDSRLLELSPAGVIDLIIALSPVQYRLSVDGLRVVSAAFDLKALHTLKPARFRMFVKSLTNFDFSKSEELASLFKGKASKGIIDVLTPNQFCTILQRALEKKNKRLL